MDLFLLITILVASIFYFLFVGYVPWIKNVVVRKSNNEKTAPEAAGAWPILGHLPLLAGSSEPAYKLFASMADKLGPVFTIKIGYRPVLIVSNSDMAKECLTKNSRVFASRPKSMASKIIGYDYANFGIAQYGPYWREMRKIIVLELGSQRRMQMLDQTRVSEVKSSIVELYTSWIRNKGSAKTAKVDMRKWFNDLNVNMVLGMMFGIRLDSQENQHLRNNSRRVVQLFGAFVPSDAINIPGLRWLDLGGYEKKLKNMSQELDAIVRGWLEDLNKKTNSSKGIDENKDQPFMAAVMSRVKELKEDLYGFSYDDIARATSSAIFQGATDSTTMTVTWALALLANDPRVLKKAQEELENHVGKHRNVEESDTKNLVYLRAIIKETMRLYPAAPLLLPHECTEDCNVGGYTIPKGTGLYINVWKIQRDPKIWTDPNEYYPERFLKSNKEIDVKGQHFELLPFGSGRRMCIGIPFAFPSLELILASLIHGFEFQNPSNKKVDMNGLSNFSTTPLELLITPRLSPDLYKELA